MKLKTLLISLSCLMFSACSVVMHPHFTNIQSILSVNRGETLDQVIDKIGFMPYDVYTQQTTGYKIVTYKYKIMERQLDQKRKIILALKVMVQKNTFQNYIRLYLPLMQMIN